MEDQDKQGAKPLGLVLVIILQALAGIIGVVGGIGFTAASGFSAWAPLVGFVLLGLGVVQLSLVYGLWVLAPWSHPLTRTVAIISIPLGVIMALIDRSAGNIIGQIIGIGIDIAILSYFSKIEIKRLFGVP